MSKMTQILITPLPGTARSFNGRVLTGGHHYMLVQKNEVEILNALTMGVIAALEGVEVDKPISPTELDQLVRELAVSREKEKDESYEDYRANLYRFAVEAMTSELQEEKLEEKPEPKPTTGRRKNQNAEPKPADAKSDEDQTKNTEAGK